MAPTTGIVRGVAAGVSVLLADNPGPMTLDGTNSYLLASSSGGLVVVDPGPDDEHHLRTLAGEGPVELILITHRHADHTAGAGRFSAMTGAPVRALDRAHCHGADPLADAEVLDVGELRIRVLATPGHTSDSVCFHVLEADGPGAVLTGDTVLGRGTTVITHPDGELGPYLDSVRLLAELGPALVLPGHGPELPDLAAVCQAYLDHRLQRLDSVRAAQLVLGGNATVAAVTDLVYAGLDPAVRGAAELSVAAQLEYLGRSGGNPTR
jgi:glyoxylase-like metal-dependent hydrolase (beta-lactamase superfamily II)